jgi:coatomer protein complex subunit epsilon
MAKKELKKMDEVDEDSTLCKLTKSWIGLATGGEGELSHEEAFYNFKELAEKCV